ncbi:hypothetical protein [Flexivirga oryzae]|uniref:Uncharacterized protein n=1 Tax=Flexivirga oryzae TaxID=1794944 RepID=A0A839NAE1_9MICO|nr:hypothetical protein [Flexivirga oryzae]MBB2891681.1 hypothetical protein [Flexivirga oryzae]
MTLERWQLRDPKTTLLEINERCPLELGRTVVAAVRMTDQAVTAARVALEPGQHLRPHPYDSDLARGIAEEIAPDRGSLGAENGGISHILVTVVCRDGYVVPARREFEWFRAWRYSNHFRGAIDGDVYVVTPHGWTGALDSRAGYEPCLVETKEEPS